MTFAHHCSSLSIWWKGNVLNLAAHPMLLHLQPFDVKNLLRWIFNCISLYGAAMAKSMKTRFSSHFFYAAVCCYLSVNDSLLSKKKMLYSFCWIIKVGIITTTTTLYKDFFLAPFPFHHSLITLWLFKTCKASELNIK